MERAIQFRKTLADLDDTIKTDLAMMNKHRERPNEVESMELVGSVKGMDCVIVDDMIDTAGTLCQAAKILKENGAHRIFACITHALLNDPATKRILDSEIELIFLTNTVVVPEEKLTKKVIMCCLGQTISECIRRIHNCESISNMF
jgi:ribose-phosphate pyrophosphokinase